MTPVEITPWHWIGFIACILIVIALDLGAQRLAGRNQMLLSDEFVQRAGTHAVG